MYVWHGKSGHSVSSDLLSRGERSHGAQDASHSSNLARVRQRLLVKSRQIARSGLAEEGLGGGSSEEAEIVHHVGLVGVAGCKSNFGEAFAGVPQTADMLQTGQAADGFG